MYNFSQSGSHLWTKENRSNRHDNFIVDVSLDKEVTLKFRSHLDSDSAHLQILTGSALADVCTPEYFLFLIRLLYTVFSFYRCTFTYTLLVLPRYALSIHELYCFTVIIGLVPQPL